LCIIIDDRNTTIKYQFFYGPWIRWTLSKNCIKIGWKIITFKFSHLSASLVFYLKNSSRKYIFCQPVHLHFSTPSTTLLLPWLYFTRVHITSIIYLLCKWSLGIFWHINFYICKNENSYNCRLHAFSTHQKNLLSVSCSCSFLCAHNVKSHGTLEFDHEK
jgi:hypothetical protein